MSSLAFDKQGKPFTFHRKTKQLLVRLFRNPSARGTCCQVLDAEGEPLHIDPETDYMEFRKAVGHVPGLYRLDQCDENGAELSDAQAAYVSVDVARNAQTGDAGAGEVSPLIIIQQMAATQAEVMKTMAAQHGALMAAAAEILRAPYRPAPAPVPATELRNADASKKDDDRDDEDDDDEIEEVMPESPATAALRMIEPHLPQLGGFLYEKFAEFLRHIYSKNAAPTAATPAPTPAAAIVAAATVPAQAAVEVGVAASSSSPTPPPPPATVQSAAASAIGGVQDATITTATITPVATNPAPVTPPIPTREQFEHLTAIRAQLSPAEQAIAQNTIARMEPQMLADWLAALSAMSVDEATELIRRMVTEIQEPRGSKPG